jgi:hypothetical protein
VRVRETHDLAGITRVGENFLVAGQAGVENDFAATTRASAGRAAFKDSSILEREYRATCGVQRQCILQRSSFRCGVHR